VLQPRQGKLTPELFWHAYADLMGLEKNMLVTGNVEGCCVILSLSWLTLSLLRALLTPQIFIFLEAQKSGAIEAGLSADRACYGGDDSAAVVYVE
jgi:hypothetical protein